MIKSTILSIPFLFAGVFPFSGDIKTSNAEIDFSLLTESSRRPKVEDIYEKFFEFRQSINYTKLTPDQKLALAELEKSFTPVTVPASLKMSKEEAPEWGVEINTFLAEELKKNKIEEALAKVVEGENKAYLTAYCDFVDPDLLDPETASDEIKKLVQLKVFPAKYSLNWNQIYDLKLAQEIGHAIYLTVITEGYNLDNNERAKCELPVSSWALKMKPEGGDVESVPYEWITTKPPLTSMKK